MTDILKSLCKSLSIELLYTNNKIKILSCSLNNNHTTIRAHKMFKECNEAAAYAIINYYAKTEDRENNLRIIKDYVDKKINFKSYKIDLPNNEFCNKVLKDMSAINPKEQKEKDFIEMNISSITKKEFYGGTQTVKPNETLKVNKGDILEVDITVDPFNT